MTQRTRAGFIDQTPLGIEVWVSHAGTGTDILVRLTNQEFQERLKIAEKHINKNINTYGLGILSKLNDIDNLYAFEGVYEGRLIMPVLTEKDIKTNFA